MRKKVLLNLEEELVGNFRFLHKNWKSFRKRAAIKVIIIFIVIMVISLLIFPFNILSVSIQFFIWGGVAYLFLKWLYNEEKEPMEIGFPMENLKGRIVIPNVPNAYDEIWIESFKKDYKAYSLNDVTSIFFYLQKKDGVFISVEAGNVQMEHGPSWKEKVKKIPYGGGIIIEDHPVVKNDGSSSKNYHALVHIGDNGKGQEIKTVICWIEKEEDVDSIQRFIDFNKEKEELRIEV